LRHSFRKSGLVFGIKIKPGYRVKGLSGIELKLSDVVISLKNVEASLKAKAPNISVVGDYQIIGQLFRAIPLKFAGGAEFRLSDLTISTKIKLSSDGEFKFNSMSGFSIGVGAMHLQSLIDSYNHLRTFDSMTNRVINQPLLRNRVISQKLNKVLGQEISKYVRNNLSTEFKNLLISMRKTFLK